MPDRPDNANDSASPAPEQAVFTGDETTFFIAPMDLAMKLSTILILALVGMVSVGLILLGVWLHKSASGWLIAPAVIVFLVGVIGVMLIRVYSRPRSFTISSEGMRIDWPGRSRKLPKGAFAEMRLVTGTELGSLTRRFGLRGVLGCFGWFTSEYMGNMDAYVTRNDGLVYLRLKNRRPILLTPTQPAEFLDTLKSVVEE
ncbi:MAG: hypothetical protein JXA11_08765 [Phycisphaerae bacterium]|nr:hypothetical protein [Phycisphaerae bacterium]